jgi:hypothetical protein
MSRLVSGREDNEYVGQYKYQVDGKTHVGSVKSDQPVFRGDQMPRRTITVFYDPADARVSRLSATVPDGTPKGPTIFGVVVLVVALAIMLISNFERLRRLNLSEIRLAAAKNRLWRRG